MIIIIMLDEALLSSWPGNQKVSFTRSPVAMTHGESPELLNKTKCKILMFDSRLKAAIKTKLILKAGHLTILFCSISHHH